MAVLTDTSLWSQCALAKMADAGHTPSRPAAGLSSQGCQTRRLPGLHVRPQISVLIDT